MPYQSHQDLRGIDIIVKSKYHGSFFKLEQFQPSHFGCFHPHKIASQGRRHCVKYFKAISRTSRAKIFMVHGARTFLHGTTLLRLCDFSTDPRTSTSTGSGLGGRQRTCHHTANPPHVWPGTRDEAPLVAVESTSPINICCI